MEKRNLITYKKSKTYWNKDIWGCLWRNKKAMNCDISCNWIRKTRIRKVYQ